MRIAELEDKVFARAKNVAYRLLTYRPRSRAEIVQKLHDKGFDAAVVESAVDDLERLGYINDRQFAEQWTESRIRLRGFGRRRIEQELRRKGISREISRETLRDIFHELSEEDVARKEAEKRLRILGRFDAETRRRRLAGFLERKGFSPEAIRAVLGMVL